MQCCTATITSLNLTAATRGRCCISVASAVQRMQCCVATSCIIGSANANKNHETLHCIIYKQGNAKVLQQHINNHNTYNILYFEHVKLFVNAQSYRSAS